MLTASMPPAPLWPSKEYGALSFVECWGDDVPDGQADFLSDGGGEMPA